MKKIFISIFLFLFALTYGQIAERPNPPKLYNNLSQRHADFISADEAAQLEEKLEQFSNNTSNQLCIVVVDDLNGLEPADYATKLINEWGIGKKESNNGMVLLLQLKPDKGGRDFIGIGYGLEGAIPDAIARRIIETRIKPAFKAKAFFQGFDEATDDLMKAAAGEYKADAKKKSRGKNDFPIVIVIIVIIILISFFGKGGGGRRNRGFGGPFIGGIPFGGTFSGGGFSGGGGSGGGGFGGFGGGSFGGGGAGGSW
jgi:uncharacterized protein